MSKLEDALRQSRGTDNEIQVPKVDDACEHFTQIGPVVPSGTGCKECLAMGDTWKQLRICMSCGQVGCCDNSKNKHATKHYHASGHPIIKSFQPGEHWLWCYPDEKLYTSA